MNSEEENLLNAFYKRTDEIKQKNISDLTVAERLMLNARDKTRTVTIDGVELEIKVLPQVALKQIATLIDSGDAEGIADALAENFIDPSINREFIESGYFTKSQMQEMIFALVESSKEEIDQIVEFRKRRDGPKPV